MSEINVLHRTQTIVVDSSSGTVSVINAGPQGPAGTAIDLTARSSAQQAFLNSEDALALAETAVQSIVAGTNVDIDSTDPNNPIINVTGGAGGDVSSVNGQTGVVVLTAEDVGAVEDDDPRLTDARTPTAHTQAISTITGLQTALDSKASAGSILDHAAETTTAHGGIVPSTRTISTGEGLTGGGNLSANRTISLSSGTLDALSSIDEKETPTGAQDKADAAQAAAVNTVMPFVEAAQETADKARAVWIFDGEEYVLSGGRTFVGPEDPNDHGFTMVNGDEWLEMDTDG